MKDKLGHEITAYPDVSYDEDVWAAGYDGLNKCMREVGWTEWRVFWCSECKRWMTDVEAHS